MADSTTIGNLELRLRSESKDAATGVEQLATAFKTLDSAVGGGLVARLSSVAKSFNAIIAASQKAAAATAKVSIPTPAVSQVQATAPVASGSASSAAANSAKAHAAATKQAAASQTQLNTAMNNTVSTSTKLTSALRNGVTRALKSMGTAIRATTTGLSRATTSMVTFFTKSNKQSQGLLRNLQMLRVNIYNLWYLFTFVGGAIGKLIQAGADWEESLHLFKVAFTGMSEEGSGAADAAYEVYQNMSKLGGLNLEPMLQMAGTFRAMTNAMGITADAGDKLAQGLTQLSYDSASLFNKDFEYTAQKFQSALAGQTKGVREFGFDITEASLNQELLAEGIDATTQSLTRAQKTILIYNTLMRQSIDHQGDFADSIMQPANLIRILREQLQMLGAAFGTLFIPMLQAALPWIIAIVQGLTQMMNRIGEFFGIKPKSMDDIVGGAAALPEDFEDTEDSAEGINAQLEKMKDYVTGLDELNILRPPDPASLSGGAGDVGAGIDIKPLDPYDFFGGKNPMEEILKSVGPALKELGEAWMDMEKSASTAFSKIRDSWDRIMGSGLGTELSNSFTGLLESIIGVFEGFFEGLSMAWDENNLGDRMIQSLTKAQIGINETLSLIFGGIEEWFTTPMGQEWFTTVLDQFARIGDAVTLLTDEFKRIWENGGKETFQEHILPALGSIVTMALSIIEAVIRITGEFVNWGLESGFLAGISDTIKEITDFIGEAALAVADWFQSPDAETFKNMLLTVQGVIGDIVSNAIDVTTEIGKWSVDSGFLDSIWNSLSDISLFVGDISQAFTDWFTSPDADGFKSLLEKIAGFVERIAQQLKDWWNQHGEKMFKSIMEVLDPIFEILGKIFEGITAFFDSPVGQFLAGIVGGLLDGISLALSTIGDILDFIVGLIDTVVKLVTGDFSGAWDTIQETVGNFWGSISEKWGDVGQWFGDNVAGPVNEKFTEISTWAGEKFDEAKTAVEDTWGKVSGWFNENVGGPISDKFKEWTDGVGENWKDASKNMKDSWDTAGKWFGDNVGAPIGKKADEIKESLGTAFTNAKEKMSGAWDTVSGWFENNVTGPIGDAFTGMSTGIENAFNTVKGVVQGLINGVIRGINTFTRGINSITLPDWLGGGHTNIPAIPEVTLARGGMPATGTTFMAGEAGPELIGSYGGNKNTVMPLEDSGFVEAMSAAVYAAVTSAMQQTGGSGQGDVYIDGVKAGKVLDKAKRLSGANGSLVSVGV